MSNAFENIGAAPIKQKPSQYKSLFTSKFFTGLWTNRNPLNEGAVPYAYTKFYQGSRNDSIIDGLNTELSSRMTLVRRPGSSSYNSNTFSPVNRYANFKPFEVGVGETIYVIADNDTDVRVISGGANTLLFTKTAGAGPTSFQQVLNTLYMVNGTDSKKWSWFPAWAASTDYSAGDCILDSSNNIQQSVGFSVLITNTSVSSNVLTVNYSSPVGALFQSGTVVTFEGLDAAPWLNNVVVTVTSAATPGQITANVTHGDYGSLSDAGLLTTIGQVGTSDVSIPTFASTIGQETIDGFNGWICKGSAVQEMGVVAPTAAPAVANMSQTSGNSWVASTYFWPDPLILDSNSNIQKLTTAGITGTGVPVWSSTPGVTTADNGGGGTAVWTCQGPGARVASTLYIVGSYILATWTKAVTKRVLVDPGPPREYEYETVYYSYDAFFKSNNQGTTSTSSTANISWPAGLGATITDGNVVWTNVGLKVTRLAAATSSPTSSGTGTTSGNVGNSVLVSILASIVSTVYGFGESVSTSGLTGAAEPTTLGFSATATAGQITQESGSGTKWLCTGPSASANTGTWVYAFSYKNSNTGDESTASKLSDAILLQTNSWISISGPGSSDTQVDTIRIYRSTQGLTTPFFLDEFPAPPSGGDWSYTDTTADPPNPGALLNVLITASGYVFSGSLATNVNDPPPTGTNYLTFHCGRLWGSVGNTLYNSTGPDVTVGNGSTSWDALNFFQLPGSIYRVVSTNFNGATLFIFTSSGLYAIPGQGTSSSPFGQQQEVFNNISLLSYDAFTKDGSTFYAFLSDKSLVSINVDSGVSDIGWPIADLLKTLDPANTQLAFNTNGSDERALYIGDFSTGWYRFASTAPPESGFLFSPKAEIVGGMSAIGSVETTAGTHSLLIGPLTSGPILQRDSTIFTDNGTNYDAWAVIGNLVLCHPGEMATVRFIGLDAIKTGAVPKVGFLGDEFLGYTNTPPFSMLDKPTDDPPNLDASQTLWSIRYWLHQQQEPFWCKHILLRFEFGTDSVQNELNSFSVYGGFLEEE